MMETRYVAVKSIKDMQDRCFVGGISSEFKDSWFDRELIVCKIESPSPVPKLALEELLERAEKISPTMFTALNDARIELENQFSKNENNYLGFGALYRGIDQVLEAAPWKFEKSKVVQKEGTDHCPAP